ELAVSWPFLGLPRASGRERDHRAVAMLQQLVHSTNVVVRGIEPRSDRSVGWLTRCRSKRKIAEREQTARVMPVVAILHALGISPASIRGREADPLPASCGGRKCAAARGSLTEKCATRTARLTRQSQKARDPSVGSALVVDEQSRDRRMRCKQCSARRCRDDVHFAVLRQSRDERRRQHDVADEARLHNERPQRSVYLQNCEERLLRDLDRSDLLHALLAFLLLLEQFALARDVATVALGEHVLAQRLDTRARDDLAAECSLDRHLEELARNEILELVGDLAAPLVRLVAMDDHGERIHWLAVDQHVELDEIALPVLEHLVIERRVSAADRLEPVEEIQNYLAQRKLEVELYARRVDVRHVLVHTATLGRERHDRSDIIARRDYARLDV